MESPSELLWSCTRNGGIRFTLLLDYRLVTLNPMYDVHRFVGVEHQRLLGCASFRPPLVVMPLLTWCFHLLALYPNDLYNWVMAHLLQYLIQIHVCISNNNCGVFSIMENKQMESNSQLREEIRRYITSTLLLFSLVYMF